MGFPERYALTTKAPDRSKAAKAINPNLILVYRFLVTALLCGLSLIAAIIAILVVRYYDTHNPIVRPSWGSLIYVIFLGLATPCLYFGYNILLPLAPFINYGDFLYGLFMTKIELLLQFGMCIMWVSAALAYDQDLGGYENCQFDGYYHYTKPADFQHVCYLTNLVIPFAYAAFGVQVFLWLTETIIAMYIFLFLDQEALSEPHFALGRRSYDFAHGKHSTQQDSNGSRAARAARASVRNSAAAGEEYDPETAGSRRTSSSRRAGRRGAAYNNPDMAESQTSLPASLGSRGQQAYADGEHTGRPHDEESGWHLRG